MKYYFMIDGDLIKGYTDAKLEDSTGNLLPNYVEVENPNEELLNDFIKYKYVHGEFILMDDEEFKKLYPNYGVIVKTLEEQRDEMLLDLEYRMSLLELEGGEKV